MLKGSFVNKMLGIIKLEGLLKRMGYFFIGLTICVSMNSNLQAADVTDHLKTKIASSAQDELIQVNISFKDNIDKISLQKIVSKLTKKEKRIVVKNALKNKAISTQKSLLTFIKEMEKTGKAKQIRSLWINNLVSVKVTKDVIEAISKMTEIESIEYDEPRNVLLSTSWGVTKIKADTVWPDFGVKGEGIVVAVIDTGIDYNHSD